MLLLRHQRGSVHTEAGANWDLWGWYIVKGSGHGQVESSAQPARFLVVDGRRDADLLPADRVDQPPPQLQGGAGKPCPLPPQSRRQAGGLAAAVQEMRAQGRLYPTGEPRAIKSAAKISTATDRGESKRKWHRPRSYEIGPPFKAQNATQAHPLAAVALEEEE